jgi:hypothetical protein
MKELEIIERIELYLEGKLKGKELQKFEDQLKNDKQTGDLFLCYKQAIDEIQSYSRNEIKERLKLIHEEVISEKISVFRRIKNSTPLRIAAILIGFAVVSSPVYLYLSSNQQNKTEKLFYTNFTPYMNITTQRGSDDMQQRSVLQNAAMHFYNNRDYNKAIVNFEELFKSQSTPDSLVLFYYGISCLGAQQNQKAIEVFTKLSSMKSYLFYEQSKWYLALSYLQTHDKESTVRTLKEIIEEKGDNTSKALHLLEELN